MKKQAEQKQKRSQRDYSLSFKLQVVSEVEKGDLSYIQAQRKYGIQGTSIVLAKQSFLSYWKDLVIMSQKYPESMIR